MTLLRDGVPLTDAATGKSVFPVDLGAGEKLSGLDISIGAGAELRVEIDGASGENIAVIDQPFQYVAGLASCGSNLSASGGSEGFTSVVELGERSGEVCLAFEAYRIPDQFEVYFGDERVYSTGGTVSGPHFETVSFDPEQYGSTKARVEVVGNEQSGTKWVAGLSCPGSDTGCTIFDNDVVDYRLVEFRFSTAACVYDVVAYVDGKQVWSGAISSSQMFTRALGANGTHQVKLQILKTSTSCMSPIYRQVLVGGQQLEVDERGVFFVPPS